MDFFKNHKNIFIGIGVVIALFIAYTYLKPESAPEMTAAVVSTQSVRETEPAVSRDIIALLIDLRSIKIKKDFFADPVLHSLQDFGTPIPDEPRGRANPFAPVTTLAPVTARSR